MQKNTKIQHHTITGGHSKQDLRYKQKPTYFPIFTNNIWSYLQWSPVIPSSKTENRGRTEPRTALRNQEVRLYIHLPQHFVRSLCRSHARVIPYTRSRAPRSSMRAFSLSTSTSCSASIPPPPPSPSSPFVRATVSCAS